jgi:TRAP-type uncharacterized transport system fused permease subunit
VRPGRALFLRRALCERDAAQRRCIGARRGEQLTRVAPSAASTERFGVIIGLNNVIRSIGTALGPQVGIAVVTATSGLVPGLPVRSGFTHAFVMAAIATAATTVLLALVPGPRSDPLVRVRPVLREDG